MNNHNITRNIAIDRAMAPAAAGTTEVDGTTIDTLGYESIVFAVFFGVITAGAATILKLQYGNASDASDMADIPNGGVTIADTWDSKGTLSVEVHRPTKRYIRAVVTRATQNAVVDLGVVIKARKGHLPPGLMPNMNNAEPLVLVSP